MRCTRVAVFLLLAGSLVLAGCGTMGGGDQLKNAVYDTHRRVASLDKALEGSVTKLNENVTGLVARLDASDQEVKVLQQRTEENTVKLGAVEKKLDSLTNNLYRYFRLSQAPASGKTGAPPEVTLEREDVGVIPPSGARAPASQPGQETLPPPAGSARTEREAPLPPPAANVAAPANAATVAPPAAAETGGSAEADYQKARRSFVNEDYSTALDQFGGYLQQHPTAENGGDAQFYRARCLQNMEKYEDAVGEFGKLRTNYPTSQRLPYAMFYEALCHSRLGQTARATELMQEIVKNYPATPAAEQASKKLKELRGN